MKFFSTEATILLIVLIFVPNLQGMDMSVSTDSNVIVKVDTSRVTGNLSPLFSSSMFVPVADTGYPMDKYFADHKPGLHEVCPITEFRFNRDIKNLKDFMKNLHDSVATKWAIRTKEKGGDVVILLGLMPWWMSSCPDAEKPHKCPPKSYDEWAKLVKAIVDFYNNKLKLNAMYVVWDEPDGYWTGTEEEFFKLYNYSVLGVKRADINARIGGPATSEFDIKSRRNNKLWIENFIEYCSKTKLPELGLQRLPIDFLIWHHFNPIPFESSFARKAQNSRELLLKYGYDQNTDIINGSWNSWLEYGQKKTELSKERNTEYLAAYVIAALKAMDDNKIQQHIFFDIFGTWDKYKNLPEFPGTFGIFTERHVIKPVYNAFRMVSMLSGVTLDVETADPFITAIATKKEKKVMLLISNYVPQGSIDEKWLKDNFLRNALPTRGYTEDKLITVFKNLEAKMSKEQLKKKREKEGLDSLPIPEDLKHIIKEVHKDTALYRERAKKRRHESLPLKIVFENFPKATKLQFMRYLIDSKHSNSYAMRKKIERSLTEIEQNARLTIKGKLKEQGIPERDIDHLQMMSEKDKQEWVNKLKPAQKQYITKEMPKVIENFMKQNSAIGINEWQGVKLQKVENKVFSKETKLTEYSIDILAAPYSVNLIIVQILD